MSRWVLWTPPPQPDRWSSRWAFPPHSALRPQTSSLDAHAQKRIFDSIERIARPAGSSARKKSVLFITHRLSTARRADKIAMMENGVSSWRLPVALLRPALTMLLLPLPDDL